MPGAFGNLKRKALPTQFVKTLPGAFRTLKRKVMKEKRHSTRIATKFLKVLLSSF